MGDLPELPEPDSHCTHKDDHEYERDAERYRAIKARHAYALVRRFTDDPGYSSQRAPAQIDDWADAAVREVKAWAAKSDEERIAWRQGEIDRLAASLGQEAKQ